MIFIAASLAALGLLIVVLRLMGRNWHCPCGFWPLIYRGPLIDVHYSQHLLDAWSVTHIGHGIFIYGAVRGFMSTWPFGWSILITLCIEGVWEIVENSPWIIEMYRRSGDRSYYGDSIVNAVGDLVCCGAAAYATSWFV